jgi:hypothetical protein
VERHSLINQLVRLAEKAARFNFWKTYLAGGLSEAEFDRGIARSKEEHRPRRAAHRGLKDPGGRGHPRTMAMPECCDPERLTSSVIRKTPLGQRTTDTSLQAMAPGRRRRIARTTILGKAAISETPGFSVLPARPYP